MLDDYQISKDRDLPKEAWDYMREKGFLGMVIPQEYGETARHSSTGTQMLSGRGRLHVGCCWCRQASA